MGKTEIDETEEGLRVKLASMLHRLDALTRRHKQAREHALQAHRIAVAKSAELERAMREAAQCRAEIRATESGISEVRARMAKVRQGRASRESPTPVPPASQFRRSDTT